MRDRDVFLMLGVLLVLLGLVVLARFTGLLSISADPVHDVTAAGQHFLLTSDWGHSGYVCVDRRLGGQDVLTTDSSSSTGISVSASLPSTGGQSCSDYTAGLTVRADRLNFQNYSKIIFYRSAQLSAAGSSGATVQSTLNGVTIGQNLLGNNPGVTSATLSLGNIYVTNDGTTIVVRSDEIPTGKVYDARQPLYLENAVSITERGRGNGGQLSYQITSVELTPFPTPVLTSPPAPTPVNTTTTIVPLSPPSGINSLLSKILAWITHLFT